MQEAGWGEQDTLRITDTWNLAGTMVKRVPEIPKETTD